MGDALDEILVRHFVASSFRTHLCSSSGALLCFWLLLCAAEPSKRELGITSGLESTGEGRRRCSQDARGSGRSLIAGCAPASRFKPCRAPKAAKFEPLREHRRSQIDDLVTIRRRFAAYLLSCGDGALGADVLASDLP